MLYVLYIKGEIMKNKIVAGLLGIFLGGFGIHKFYLNKPGQGLTYLIFCWTGIPEIIGFIEGIIYLFTSDEDFNKMYNTNSNTNNDMYNSQTTNNDTVVNTATMNDTVAVNKKTVRKTDEM